MGLSEIGWEGGLDSTGSGKGPVVSCCECGDEPSGYCTTELVNSYPGLNEKIVSSRNTT
jgi:hypothetical protein